MKNKAITTLNWCNERFDEGRNVYFSTHYKHTKVTPKNRDLLKVTKDGLRVKNDLVTSNTGLLVRVSSSFN